RGIIAGTVLDANGQVAEGARVCIAATSGDSKSGTTTQTTVCPISADKYGQFQLEHLKTGTYTVFATDADQSLRGNERGQKVTLTADAPYAHASLRLKPGGILLGSVTDAVSGKPIEQFQVQYVELDRQGSGGSTFGAHGKFRIVVPVATDLV